MMSFNFKGSAPCRTGPPSDFIQLIERPRSSSAPNSRQYVPGTSAVIPPPLTRSQSGNSIIQTTGGNTMNAGDPRNSPVHQQQQSPVSTTPSKTSPPSGITLNTTVQIIQVTGTMAKHGICIVLIIFFQSYYCKHLTFNYGCIPMLATFCCWWTLSWNMFALGKMLHFTMVYWPSKSHQKSPSLLSAFSASC